MVGLREGVSGWRVENRRYVRQRHRVSKMLFTAVTATIGDAVAVILMQTGLSTNALNNVSGNAATTAIR